MAKGSSKKAEEALQRKAMQHHDFIGQADDDRKKAREVEEERIARDKEQLESEVTREMARELEELAAKDARTVVQTATEAATRVADTAKEKVAEKVESAAEVLPLRPENVLKAAQDMLKDPMNQVPKALEQMRATAERRLSKLPKPALALLRGAENAATTLVIAPARAGLQLAAAAFRVPKAIVEMLWRPKRTV